MAVGRRALVHASAIVVGPLSAVVVAAALRPDLVDEFPTIFRSVAASLAALWALTVAISWFISSREWRPWLRRLALAAWSVFTFALSTIIVVAGNVLLLINAHEQPDLRPGPLLREFRPATLGDYRGAAKRSLDEANPASPRP